MLLVGKAQIHPLRMKGLSPGERQHRLAALALELYVKPEWSLPPRDCTSLAVRGLCHDMKVTERQVRRWRDGNTPVPGLVLVALGAMLAVRRAERAGLIVE